MKGIYFFFILLISCSQNRTNTKQIVLDIKRKDTINSNVLVNSNYSKSQPTIDSTFEFEKKIYFKIHELYTGKVYTNKNNLNVFYRVLVVPEEENIMLIAENISIGEEGGNFQLVRLSRITDDGSEFPKFGLSKVDSLKFIDTISISGYFNNKKKTINLDNLKSYHF